MSDQTPADRRVNSLFREYASTRSRRVRNELVEHHMGLASHIARRYSRGAGIDDDVRQVAMLGLVKAVDRFDPAHGAGFSSFAGRTIEGEIKRHFRDKTWVVRVPRSAKELHLLVRRASDQLGQRLARPPTVDEIAAHLDIDRDDVLRGLSASAAYSVASLDTPGGSDDGDDAPERQAVLASAEEGYGHALDRLLATELLDQLPARERRIVELRVYEEMSQSDIAAEMNMSQMHVSRLLRRSFEQLRSALAEDDGDNVSLDG